MSEKEIVLEQEDRTEREINVENEMYTNTSAVQIAYVDLLASYWHGTESPYAQTLVIDGTTENSKIDLNPSVDQLVKFYEKDIAFVVENDDGVITAYAIGQKPLDDYTMQVTITEVNANG
jgi:hypothetical protein